MPPPKNKLCITLAVSYYCYAFDEVQLVFVEPEDNSDLAILYNFCGDSCLDISRFSADKSLHQYIVIVSVLVSLDSSCC